MDDKMTTERFEKAYEKLPHVIARREKKNHEYLICIQLHTKAGKGIIESIVDDIKRDDCVVESYIVPK